MLIDPSGVRPRHGMKTCRRVHKRMLSEVKAPASAMEGSAIGPMLRR